MSRFQLKIAHHNENQEDAKVSDKRQPTDANTEMTEMLELFDRF